VVPPVEREGMWAVVNLVLSVMGVVLAVLVSVRALLLKKKENVDAVDETKQKNVDAKNAGRGAIYDCRQNSRDTDNDKKFTQRRSLWLIATVVLAVVGIVVFLLTEDTRFPMSWVDEWTIVNAAILLVEIVAVLFVFKQATVETRQNSSIAISNKSM
jgi:hypothetical protein